MDKIILAALLALIAAPAWADWSSTGPTESVVAADAVTGYEHEWTGAAVDSTALDMSACMHQKGRFEAKFDPSTGDTSTDARVLLRECDAVDTPLIDCPELPFPPNAIQGDWGTLTLHRPYVLADATAATVGGDTAHVEIRCSVPETVDVAGLGNVKYVSNYAGADLGVQINAAIDAVPAGGTVVVDVSGTISTRIDIDQDNTTLRCEPGVVLTLGDPFSHPYIADPDEAYMVHVRTGLALDVTENVVIEKCTFDGNGDTDIRFMKGLAVNNFTFRNNIVRDFVSTDVAVHQASRFYGIQNSAFTDNYFYNYGCSALAISEVAGYETRGVLVSGNKVHVVSAANPTCSPLVSQASTGPTANITFSDNYIENDETGFCIEVFSGAGDAGNEQNTVIANNHCYRTGPGGCWSVVGQVNTVVKGNLCDSDGSAAGGATEFDSDGGVFDSNVIISNDGSGSPFNAACTHCVISNNVITGVAPTGLAIALNAVVPVEEVSDMIVTGNVITNSGPNADFGIEVVFDNGNSLRRVKLESNHIYGDGTADFQGINISEHGTSVVEQIDLVENAFHNMDRAIVLDSGIDSVGLIRNEFHDVATPYIIVGGGAPDYFVESYGADPPVTGANCRNGSTWLDTDTTSDTNCTTGNNGDICRCVGGAWIASGSGWTDAGTVLHPTTATDDLGNDATSTNWGITDAGVGTFDGGLTAGSVSDAADTGSVRLDNADSICWEADAAGTDVCVTVDASETVTVTGGLIRPTTAATTATNCAAATEGALFFDTDADELCVCKDSTGYKWVAVDGAPAGSATSCN